MIRVDETDPVGEIEPSFPYRDVTVRRGIDFKDHYDIESEIGRGKFGTVYRCKEKSGGLQLAAKVVNTARKEDRRAVEREVEIMRRLQHPRLIQLYDAIDTGKLIYVILELIEGGELFERVIDDDFVLTERSCAVFMRQICEGMEFVHAQNILHLDMKPENILCLTKEGNRIKIIDFGLARQYDPAKKLQVLFGTPEFVAPEVVNFDQIGFGTDMWSIGVICYVLLSGLSPFMGDTDIETMANVTIAKYDFDDEAFAEISDDAKDFIRCLLVKDKEGRLTASQCQKHPWLARKYPPTSKILPKTAEVKKPKAEVELAEAKEELDMAKDNLRLFVERWREHPDSPYLIELDDHRWDPDAGKSLRNGVDETNNVELVSLRGHSPSPCGSICSSITSESPSSPRDSGNYLTVQNLGFPFERRASDGQSQEKTKDHAAQIVLAEEIIKLSEHLRSIAMGPRVVCSGEKDKSEQQTLAPGSTASGKVANSSKSASNSTKVISENFDSPLSAKTTSKIGKEKVTAEREKLPRTASMKRNGSVSSETNEISEKLSTITNQRKLNGTTFNGVRNFERSSETSSASSFTLKRRTSRLKTDTGTVSDSSTQESTRNDRLFDHKETSKTSSFLQRTNFSRDHSSSSAKTEADLEIPPFQKSERKVDLTPPWRRARAKHRFGETCRDVPRISNLQDMHQNLNLDEPASTKNLLLQLLNEWDDVSRPSRVGRKSVSVDWCGGESIARRSMNSLAEYFQSEQKRPASGVSSTTPPSSSIHR